MNIKRKIKVLVVDDSLIFRETLLKEFPLIPQLK